MEPGNTARPIPSNPFWQPDPTSPRPVFNPFGDLRGAASEEKAREQQRPASAPGVRSTSMPRIPTITVTAPQSSERCTEGPLQFNIFHRADALAGTTPIHRRHLVTVSGLLKPALRRKGAPRKQSRNVRFVGGGPSPKPFISTARQRYIITDRELVARLIRECPRTDYDSPPVPTDPHCWMRPSEPVDFDARNGPPPFMCGALEPSCPPKVHSPGLPRQPAPTRLIWPPPRPGSSTTKSWPPAPTVEEIVDEDMPSPVRENYVLIKPGQVPRRFSRSSSQRLPFDPPKPTMEATNGRRC